MGGGGWGCAAGGSAREEGWKGGVGGVGGEGKPSPHVHIYLLEKPVPSAMQEGFQ